MCGASIDGRRRDALVCGPACRRERSRLRALLRGRGDGPYETVGAYLARRQRRAKLVHTDRGGSRMKPQTQIAPATALTARGHGTGGVTPMQANPMKGGA